MHTSYVSAVTPRTVRRSAIAPGIFFLSMAAAACAQKPVIDENQPPYELPMSYGVLGHLTRDICAETFPVGDTVSVTLVPSPFSRPTPWPREFRVLLRREMLTEPNPASQIRFNAESANADGFLISESIGTFTPDIESGRNEVDRPPGECYPKGATVYGSLSRPLRIPRMK